MIKVFGVKANAGVGKATIEAVVTRADGTREYMGIISHYDRNPLKRWWWAFVHNFIGHPVTIVDRDGKFVARIRRPAIVAKFKQRIGL